MRLIDHLEQLEANSGNDGVGHTRSDLLAYTRERKQQEETVIQVSKMQGSNRSRMERGVFDLDDLVHVEIPGFVEDVQWLRWNSLIPKVAIFMLSENGQFLMSQYHQSLNR